MPEIDPTRVQRFEGVKRLGDAQGGVVGEHDHAGADPYLLGCRRYVGDEYLRDELAILGMPRCSASQKRT